MFGESLVGRLAPGLLTTSLALVIAPAAAAPGEPPVAGGVAVDTAYVNANIPFWLRLTNDGPTALTELHFSALGSDVDIHSVCAAIAAETGCVPPPTRLEPGQALMVDGHLRFNRSGNKKPVVLIRARNGSAPTPLTIPVPLSSVSVEGYAFAWLNWFKDLAFPMVLALIGYWYQRQQRLEQEAKERQQAAERALRENSERDRRGEEKKAADRVETLRSMLPLTHRYAIRHYLPLQVAVSNLHRSATSRPTATIDEISYWFLKTYLALRRLLLDVGGYYFADRTGEKLVVSSFSKFEDTFFGKDTNLERALSDVIDALQSEKVLTYARYVDRVSPPPPGVSDPAQAALAAKADVVRQRLTGWLPTAQVELHLVGAFAAVLEFEMNRLYQTWYSAPEKLRMSSEIREALVKAVPEYASYLDEHCQGA